MIKLEKNVNKTAMTNEERIEVLEKQVEAQQELLNLLSPYVIKAMKEAEELKDNYRYNYDLFKGNRKSMAEAINETGALSEPIEIDDWI